MSTDVHKAMGEWYCDGHFNHYRHHQARCIAEISLFVPLEDWPQDWHAIYVARDLLRGSLESKQHLMLQDRRTYAGGYRFLWHVAEIFGGGLPSLYAVVMYNWEAFTQAMIHAGRVDELKKYMGIKDEFVPYRYGVYIKCMLEQHVSSLVVKRELEKIYAYFVQYERDPHASMEQQVVRNVMRGAAAGRHSDVYEQFSKAVCAGVDFTLGKLADPTEWFEYICDAGHVKDALFLFKKLAGLHPVAPLLASIVYSRCMPLVNEVIDLREDMTALRSLVTVDICVGNVAYGRDSPSDVAYCKWLVEHIGNTICLSTLAVATMRGKTSILRLLADHGVELGEYGTPGRCRTLTYEVDIPGMKLTENTDAIARNAPVNPVDVDLFAKIVYDASADRTYADRLVRDLITRPPDIESYHYHYGRRRAALGKVLSGVGVQEDLIPYILTFLVRNLFTTYISEGDPIGLAGMGDNMYE